MPEKSRRASDQAFLLLGPALICAISIGCGGKNRLEVAPVSGRVVFRGQGIPRAIVIFHPEEEAVEHAKKLRPFAYADDSGNFQLKTYVAGDGAPPGSYRVSIIARSSGGVITPRKDTLVNEGQPVRVPAVRIPPEITKKYANVETSGIQVTIHEGENNLEPFAL